MVQELKAMIMGLMHWEGRSFSLLVKIYEASRTRLQLSLVVSIHCAKLHWIYSMIMKRLFSLSVAGRWLKSAETLSSRAIDVVCLLLSEELIVLPHLVQNARASFRCRNFSQRRLLLCNTRNR